MILFPAIDLKGGACVRLIQGDLNQATIFNLDPAAQARQFEQQGFEYLHLVDLDGAVAGRPVNEAAVESILEAVNLPIQLGGGIRDERTIDLWLSKGITRVILGTIAAKDPAFVRQMTKRYKDQIVVGLDARDGMVAVQGWVQQSSQLSVLDLAQRFEDAGVAALIFTDIARDGILTGLNLEATCALAESVHIPVIASGGLASLTDIDLLLSPPCVRLAGAITGRALYDGRLDPAQALAKIARARSHEKQGASYA